MSEGASGARPPDLELAGLERVAAWMGLPELRARVVPPGRRSDPWFRRADGELQVSERVVERLSPADAEVLLVDVLLHERAVTRLSILLVAGGLAAGLASVLAFAMAPGAFPAVVVLLMLGWGAAAAIGWSRATLAADDETIRRTGEPDTLVRSLNLMNQDELRLGTWHLKARSDVHRRAERLVVLHQLRLPPDQRSVPPTPPSADWSSVTGRRPTTKGCGGPATTPDAPAPLPTEGVPDSNPPRG